MRSDAFLEARGLAVRETVDARKARYGAKELEALFRGGRELTVVRGAKRVVIDLAKAGAKELEIVLGPSGNLRAPTARVGKDWLVGFDAEAWRAWLGARK